MSDIFDHPFHEIEPLTFYAILRLRIDVFVVEQNCPYPELDGFDIDSDTRHIWIADKESPVSYLRVLRENKEVNRKIYIEAKSEYNKIILSKDGTGEVTNYQLEVEVIFLIKSNNKEIKITENKIMKSMADKFEETKYEKSTKQGFASSITYKLISELIINWAKKL